MKASGAGEHSARRALEVHEEYGRQLEIKVRFRGLAKNTAHVITLFALSNRWQDGGCWR